MFEKNNTYTANGVTYYNSFLAGLVCWQRQSQLFFFWWPPAPRIRNTSWEPGNPNHWTKLSACPTSLTLSFSRMPSKSSSCPSPVRNMAANNGSKNGANGSVNDKSRICDTNSNWWILPVHENPIKSVCLKRLCSKIQWFMLTKSIIFALFLLAAYGGISHFQIDHRTADFHERQVVALQLETDRSWKMAGSDF